MKKNRLIVIRGPSGSGKTSASKELFKTASRRCVIIQQDYYRFIFNPSGGGSKPNSTTIHKMIKSNVSIALDEGYDVILEGILTKKSYGVILDDIFSHHEGPVHLFYFKVSLEETIRRNDDRFEEPGFTADTMRRWFPSAGPLGYSYEHILPESFEQKKVVQFIRETSCL